jgi:iron complex outermembrane recepter protein
LDYYSISISKAIASVSATQIVNTCEVNPNNALCSQLIYTAGVLSEIITQPVNAATQSTSGFDFQADYNMDMFAGNMAYRVLGNYNDEQTQTLLGVYNDYANSLGGNSPIIGAPKFKATIAATYSEGPVSVTAQTRLIGAALNNNQWTTGVQISNNNVPFVAYFDLRASYMWNSNIQLYGAVDNVDNTPPPDVPINDAVNDYTTVPTSTTTYDLLGRVFRAGVRFNY